jgi:multicomponent Na+:H+ antiporter subunit D
VISQSQLLLFAALAFWVLIRTRLYPLETPSVNLDTDWVYRRLLPALTTRTAALLEDGRMAVTRAQATALNALFFRVYRTHGPEGVFARTWATGSSVLWVVVLLCLLLILYYV